MVMMPNPFYQIYEGAALLSGAEPYFYSTLKSNNYLPDFDAIDEETWKRCQLIYICTPGNPTGAVMGREDRAPTPEELAEAREELTEARRLHRERSDWLKARRLAEMAEVDSARRSGSRPPWMMPNSAWSGRSWASRQRSAQVSARSKRPRSTAPVLSDGSFMSPCPS